MVKTATSDRECNLIRTCGGSSFETKAYTPTSDRVCKAHRVCAHPVAAHNAGEWTSKPAGTHHDRECSPLTTCDYAVQFEAVLAGTRNDRVCHDLRVCDHADQHTGTGPTQYTHTPKTNSPGFMTLKVLTSHENGTVTNLSSNVCRTTGKLLA